MVARIAVSRLALLLLLTFPSTRAAHSEEDEDGEGQQQQPRGVYHFSDTDRDIESSFKIPDFEALDPIKVASDLMSSAMKVDTKRKTLAGIQMPFSLTGRPMSLHINGESHDAVSLVDDPKKHEKKKKTSEMRRSPMTPESRQAFLRARQVCLEQSADSCDQALDTFHRIRYGKSLLMSEDGDEEEEENGRYRSIIERRLKEAADDNQSTPSTSSTMPSEHPSTLSSFRSSSESDPYVTSRESHETEDVEEEEEEEDGDSREHGREKPPHRFSHITLPKYHDKAHNFLRDIN